MQACTRFLNYAARARPRSGLIRRLSTTAALREKDADKYYVTQPIFYVNSVPHIGHFYTVVLADVIKRYAGMQGKSTKMSAGTDEHGLKIQQAAERANRDTLSFCTQYSNRFRDLQAAANADSPDFIRTTDPRHRLAVEHFWNLLVDRGYIYKGEHSGWYSVSDEAFYTELQVEERVDPATDKRGMFAIESGQPVEWVSEVNYKFKLSEFRDRLIEWIEDGQDVVYPEIRRNEVLSWLRAGIDDLSVSRPRSRLKWGIPVPGDDEHTIYVWVDALVNYATVDGYPWTDSKPSFFPPDVQVVGKDIVRFHAVYWPALLMAAGLALPKRILAHAHWTMGSQKMSKSKGNVADPFEDIERYGLDTLRYFMIRNGGISDDGDYATDEVLVRHRKDLAGQLANLAARCSSERLGVNIDGFAVLGRKLQSDIDSRDVTLHGMLAELADKAKPLFDKGEFGRGLGLAFDVLAEANRHITENEPWTLVKSSDPEEQTRLQVVLFYSLEAVRLASLLLLPTIPEKANRLLDHIAVDKSERLWANARFGAGWQTPGPKKLLPGVATLFPKLA